MQPSGVWALKPMADMSQGEFRDWQALLEERTGVVINEQRRAFLQTNLTARMRELGVDDYASYYRQVTDGPRGAVEWSTLLDRLTVQETRFFRHRPSFDVLESYLRGRLVTDESPRPLALWSVGCSSGEEPYSMAISVAEILEGAGSDRQFGVTGTDISLSALNKAREAVYGARKLEQMDSDLCERYFLAQDDGRYKVVPDLAARVCAARLNVLELAKAPQSGMDVIFCQNLLIYFRRWRRREILNRLAERLVPGGLLVVGVGEVIGWQHPDLVPVADERVLAFTRKG
ncbi:MULTISPECIES: protein-glutamate O-methyltransferase [Pseudomonas]|uniref:CheR family methyltransferase n=1 Tax=Pseudomonas TaxID=286 RepID=UPI001C7F55C5|nr:MULTISPECIES: protein-glutamate O-methyltransferase [Pseudomonas]MDG9926474.1 protein-glutamate O-methyltransferase [Pseudomonas sp. GD04042]MDH0481442.1 protein-glutamate O-methyltransferase [Pseudomonas sp. GD04015]MDH0603390.1 protein-glutamate O-methyltransferase [Pseudomonas sp. GD03869]MDH0895155.1 protein-glutamate O-methyltransferase [Pseudomonas sp. GD03875]MDH1064486.1 protein-glutamate O-methyltransferase [Pseudomonas sp. GD03985]